MSRNVRSELLAAVKIGDAAQLQKSIDEGANVNAKNALHLAVILGNVNIAKILLHNGADVLRKAKNGTTALHLSVARNDIRMADVLLTSASRSGKLRELLDAEKTDTGDTALHLAVVIADPRSRWLMSVLLLSHGAKFDAKNKLDAQPRQFAPGWQLSLPMMLNRIEWNFDIAKFGAKPLAFLCLASADLAEYLCATNCRDDRGCTLLQVVLEDESDRETIEFLVKLRSERSSGFVVREKGMLDEVHARVQGLAGSMKSRLEMWMRCKDDDWSVYERAAQILTIAKEVVDVVQNYEEESIGNLNVRSIAETVEYLEDKQRKMLLNRRKFWLAVLPIFQPVLFVRDAICEALMIDAVERGELQRVERCLDGNPNMSEKLSRITVNSTKEEAVPVDAFARMNLQPEATQSPIKNYTTSTTKSYVALHLAAKNNDLEIVKCLLKHGAVYCARNEDNKTPEELASDEKVVTFFRMIDRLFALAKEDKAELLIELEKLKCQGDFLVVMNTRNEESCTLSQIIAKHERIVQDIP